MNKTGIEYLDFTWNPVTGCTFGCPECWARAVAMNRLGYKDFNPRLHPERLDQPAQRKKPAVIGVGFMGDLFDRYLNEHSVHEVFHAADNAPQHQYIFLTKMPKRMEEFCRVKTVKPNWYLGFSARTQAELDAGWPHMEKLAAAGWKVWISLEPMHEEISIMWAAATREFGGNCLLSQVIIGAESGSKNNPLNIEWVRKVRDQCAINVIPFMYKQGPGDHGDKMIKMPLLDGVKHDDLVWRL